MSGHVNQLPDTSTATDEILEKHPTGAVSVHKTHPYPVFSMSCPRILHGREPQPRWLIGARLFEDLMRREHRYTNAGLVVL